MKFMRLTQRFDFSLPDADTLGGGRRRLTESPHRLSVIGCFHACPSTSPRRKASTLKAGLDVEYIQMRSAIGPQAILNGNIHFFTSPQSAINAAVAGFRWWSCCHSTAIRLGCW